MSIQIFISHKMPTDTALAEQIAAKLALYAGNQVKVIHAGRFRYGDKWRQRIQEELSQSDWVIFLHTDQDEDWGFCLFELGYFRNVMDAEPNRRLITLCRNPSQLNDALKEFNAQVMSEDGMFALLSDIYLRDPLRLAPDLDPAELRKTAAEITAAFLGSERVEKNFDVATNIIIELSVNDEARVSLKRSVLPSTVVISGTKDWQRLFGRDIDTGGWQWSDLISQWPHGGIYGFLIATMIDDALDARMPKGTLISTPDGQLHRLTLRRYERLAGNDRHRFYFTVAPADLPFEVTVDSQHRHSITAIYHLLNVSWFFRRRIVEQIYERLLEITTQPQPNQIEITRLYDHLSRELMQISAQAIIRQIDSPLTVLRALGESDKDAQEFVEELKRAGDTQQQVYEHLEAGASSIGAIVAPLSELADLNYGFLQRISQRFAGAVSQLSEPSKPDKHRA